MFTPLRDLDEARRVTPAGSRLEAVRAAAVGLRERLLGLPKALSVRTFDIATFPYPTRHAFAGATPIPAPYVMMTNRCQLVVFRTDEGLRRMLVNPSDWVGNMETPFFKRTVGRLGGSAVKIASRLFGELPAHLEELGVAGESIDYVTFDHLHTQDCRRLLGEWTPRARLLVMRAEREIFQRLHPLQRNWYLPDALAGVPEERIVVLDGDVLVGDGVALVATPGHTWGNHTIVLHTDRGLWCISENGVACDAYSPAHSHIAGLKRSAAADGVEAILNSNTREGSLDQYTSMVLEAQLADRVPEAPEFLQHFPSSELTASWLAPGLAPTYSHRAITHGVQPTAVR
jgi:glyoxylase-like metal-dependent hydrolase (beta-lactamase superfamily II)